MLEFFIGLIIGAVLGGCIMSFMIASSNADNYYENNKNNENDEKK